MTAAARKAVLWRSDARRLLADVAARLLLALCLAIAWTASHAALPAAYSPVVVEPSGPPDALEFDLRPAIAQARQEGRKLYVYLGAHDCGYCRRYERFLADHTAELVPQFRALGWLVVDLRSSLRITSERLRIRVGERAEPYMAFQQRIGDERTRALVYPSVWLLDAATLKPLMQMPAGNGTFETVPEQLEILRLQP